jgi:hypothetical protein
MKSKILLGIFNFKFLIYDFDFHFDLLTWVVSA